MGATAQAIFYGLAVLAFVLVVVLDVMGKRGLTPLGLVALGLALAFFVNFYNAAA